VIEDESLPWLGGKRVSRVKELAGFRWLEMSGWCVGQAQVHLPWPVPGNSLVGPDGVVLQLVLLGMLASITASSISSMNRRSYFKVPNPRSRDPFCPGVLTRSGRGPVRGAAR